MTVPDHPEPSRAEVFASLVATSDDNLLVIAPPGCGKTELLARRARHLTGSLQRQERLLALTFSNKAKANLSNRLREVLGADLIRRYVSVRNFHGHAAEIVRSHGATLDIATDFEPPNRRTLADAMAPYLDGLSDKDAGAVKDRLETELRTAKQRPYDDAQVLEWLNAYASAEAVQIEEQRQSTGAIHYDDLLRHAQRLLRVSEIAHLYQTHYGAILVDEFQDLSPQQLDIALRSVRRSRTFVGDPLQGIYTWAGARPEQVERQLRRICGDPSGLGVSYRSSPRVLALLNAVAAELGGHALEPDDEDAWFEGGMTAGFAADTGEEEAARVVELCQAISQRQPTATIGVISRMGWRRKLIDQAFVQAEVPHVRWDLAIDDPRTVDLLSAAAARLGSGDLEPEALRAEMLTGIDSADIDTRADVDEAIGQLAEWAASAGSLRAALNLLVDPDDDAPTRPGVHLLNAHVGKGQQFDWVFIPGFEDGHLPSFLARGRAAELREEKRILLVMLSRARHGVVLSRSKTLISKNDKTYDTKRSPWTSVVTGSLSANANGLRTHLATLPSPTV